MDVPLKNGIKRYWSIPISVPVPNLAPQLTKNWLNLWTPLDVTRLISGQAAATSISPALPAVTSARHLSTGPSARLDGTKMTQINEAPPETPKSPSWYFMIIIFQTHLGISWVFPVHFWSPFATKSPLPLEIKEGPPNGRMPSAKAILQHPVMLAPHGTVDPKLRSLVTGKHRVTGLPFAGGILQNIFCQCEICLHDRKSSQ